MAEMFEAVAKALVERGGRLWLAHRAAERDRHKDLTQLIEVRFADSLHRREVAHQMESVAFVVEKRLRKLGGHEWRDLDEPDRTAGPRTSRRAAGFRPSYKGECLLYQPHGIGGGRSEGHPDPSA